MDEYVVRGKYEALKNNLFVYVFVSFIVGVVVGFYRAQQLEKEKSS